MVWGWPHIRQGFAHNFQWGVGEAKSLILNRAICSKLNLLHIMLQIWQSYFLPFWSFFSGPGVNMWVTTTHFERSVCPVNLRKNVFFMPRVHSMDRWFWGFQAVVKTGGIQAPEKKCDLGKLLYFSEDEWIFPCSYSTSSSLLFYTVPGPGSQFCKWRRPVGRWATQR